MRRISSMVATTAAVAIAVPVYVLPWSPGSNTAATSRAGPARADRHAVAHRLGQRHHVGLDAGVLESEPPSGAPEPGLDLVDHHQRAGARRTARGSPAGTPWSPGARRPRPGSARSARRRPIASTAASQRVDVAPRDVLEALRHRLERLVLGRLAGGGERGQGAAVEAAERADDDVAAAAAVLAGQLDARTRSPRRPSW